MGRIWKRDYRSRNVGKIADRQYQPFKGALLFGATAQDRVTDVLRAAGGFANNVDDFSRYDFELHFNNHTFRVEVKNEDRYATSGNICVETRQGFPLRPSGVAWSEATVFIHTLMNFCVVYRRREMHAWLRDEFKGGRKEQAFGDNNNRGFVIAISVLESADWFDYCRFADMPSSSIWTY